MNDYAHVRGLREIGRFLDELPPQVERSILRGGVRAGGVVIMRRAETLVAVESGDLRRSLRVSTRARGGVVTATVIAGNAIAYYAQMAEYGTQAHDIKPKRREALKVGGLYFSRVSHPGAKEQPFMRPAMDGEQQNALLAVGLYARARLTKAGLNASGIELTT